MTTQDEIRGQPVREDNRDSRNQTLEELYEEFFVVLEDARIIEGSLEQPDPLLVVPNTITYGVGEDPILGDTTS